MDRLPLIAFKFFLLCIVSIQADVCPWYANGDIRYTQYQICTYGCCSQVNSPCCHTPMTPQSTLKPVTPDNDDDDDDDEALSPVFLGLIIGGSLGVVGLHFLIMLYISWRRSNRQKALSSQGQNYGSVTAIQQQLPPSYFEVTKGQLTPTFPPPPGYQQKQCV